MSDLFIIDHPLVQSKLALLRDKNTNNKEFRELVSEVSGLLAYEATRDMEVKTENIETPLLRQRLRQWIRKLVLYLF